jgi:hypothetical protein
MGLSYRQAYEGDRAWDSLWSLHPAQSPFIRAGWSVSTLQTLRHSLRHTDTADTPYGTLTLQTLLPVH